MVMLTKLCLIRLVYGDVDIAMSDPIGVWSCTHICIHTLYTYTKVHVFLLSTTECVLCLGSCVNICVFKVPTCI